MTTIIWRFKSRVAIHNVRVIEVMSNLPAHGCHRHEASAAEVCVAREAVVEAIDCLLNSNTSNIH